MALVLHLFACLFFGFGFDFVSGSRFFDVKN